MTATEERSTVLLKDGELRVTDFVTTEPSVVGYFSEVPTDELSREFAKCVALGVRVAYVAVPSLKAEVVRRQFDDALRRQRTLLEDRHLAPGKELTAGLTPVFGADGSLSTTLRQTYEGIHGELSKYFDEDSAKSISATVAKRVDEAVRLGEERVQRHLQEALDLGDDSRGLGKPYRSMRKESETLNAQLVQILERVSILTARRDERQSSPRKGDDFEEDIFLEIAQIARIYGDSVERTGTQRGIAARSRGDIVVTLDAALGSITPVCFTLEAMDRANASQRSVLQELDEAKINRGAKAAIPVLSSRKASAANGQPLQPFPSQRFICVCGQG